MLQEVFIEDCSIENAKGESFGQFKKELIKERIKFPLQKKLSRRKKSAGFFFDCLEFVDSSDICLIPPLG